MASSVDGRVGVSSDHTEYDTTQDQSNNDTMKDVTTEPDQIGIKTEEDNVLKETTISEKNLELKKEEDFSKKTWKEDVKLNVEGNLIYVSGCMLACTSPVFSSMFESAFKNEGPRTIEITGKVYGDFLEFLRCIYPSVMKKVTIDNVMSVLPLAYEYQVRSLINKCEQTLIDEVSNKVSPEVIFKYLMEAKAYSLGGLLDVCIQLARNMSQADTKRAENEYRLPLEVKCQLQEKRIDELESQLAQLHTSHTEIKELVMSLRDGGSQRSKVQIKKMVLVLKNQSVKGCYGSQSIRVNGIEIIVYATKNLYEALYFYIKCHKEEPPYELSCKIFAKLKILNHDNKSKHISLQKDLTFSEDNRKHDLDFVYRSTIFSESGGFLKDGDVQCEVYLLIS